jgi:hypothetical protein
MIDLEIGGNWRNVKVDGQLLQTELFDIDAIHFRAPIELNVRNKQNLSIKFEEVGLLSVSFVFGVLTSITVNPHLKSLTLSQCNELKEVLDRKVFESSADYNAGFPRKVINNQMISKDCAFPVRFPLTTDSWEINLVVREHLSGDFDSYLLAVEVFDSNATRIAYSLRSKARNDKFPAVRKRILLSEFN